MKRLRITRSILLGGEHAEKGSIRDVESPLADDLIAQGSAVRLNFVSRFFARIRSFVDSRTEKKERN